jgi:hypothetical protein
MAGAEVIPADVVHRDIARPVAERAARARGAER